MESNPLTHPLLFGEYELTIDEKNRLLIPAEVRKAMVPERDGGGLFLIDGINRVPWLYTERYYEQLAMRVGSDLSPQEDLLAYDQLNFALTSRLDLDKQGRVLFPEKSMRRLELGREVTLIGVRDHLELWNRQAWEERRAALLQRSKEVAWRAKQARQVPPNQQATG